MLDLARLESFVIAAEKLSFSEAAKQLHLSQPTISHHIKSLEQEFDVALFDRSGRQLRLTEAGRLLLPMAHQLLHQSLEVEEMMASCRDEVVGHLRIACSTTSGKYILPLLAARFRRRHPGIRVTILGCTPDFVIERLIEGEANISVASREIQDPGVQTQPFFDDRIELIVPAGHRWAGRETLLPEELLEEPQLIMGPESGTRRVLLSELARHDINLDDLRVLLELGNAEAIVHTVQAGFGVAFVSTLASTMARAAGRVVLVPVENLNLRRTIYMVRLEMAPPNRTQEAFWSFIHDESNRDLLQLPLRPSL
jgi:DNA-binding transcriptional LysR family regulator